METFLPQYQGEGQVTYAGTGGECVLFSCGPNRTWTYRVNSLGEEKRLADSQLPGLSYPGPLYDCDMDYCYLFGGSRKSKKSTAIQVYDPKANAWTEIRAALRIDRSYFTPVKYKRRVYLAGGCNVLCVEEFDLDTGKANWDLRVSCKLPRY